LDQNKAATISTIQWEFFGLNFSPVVQPSLRQFSTVPGRVIEEDLVSMTDEELDDNSTIPGWEFVHSPPRTMPRGALVGTVVSDKMNKTVNVAVERYRIVPKYRKRLRYTRKFMAHDEKEVANVGDLVMIVPCHRISKRKHFMLREIIRATGQL
jgi:small subunit ribosomal protein S17